MKHLNDLKKEKEMLVLQVEREEEYLTNTLQKKLEQVRIIHSPFLDFFLWFVLIFWTVEKRKSGS
jgi:hypothetical protein